MAVSSERVVIEARQRRRMEEERQQMANNQVKAHQQPFACSELFHFFVQFSFSQNLAPAPSSIPAATPAATLPTATPAINLKAPVSSQKYVGSQLGKLQFTSHVIITIIVADVEREVQPGGGGVEEEAGGVDGGGQ